MRFRDETRDRTTGESSGVEGCLALVVGPSGAGKDTLIDAARARFAHDPRFSFPLRVISRPPSPGEQHLPVDERQFEADEAAGRFLLSWRSHGLSYAIPARVQQDLVGGRVVVANVSRTVVPAAEQLVANVAVLVVTASREARLARIDRRGREAKSELDARVSRDVLIEASRSPVIEVRNDGALEVAEAAFTRALQELAEQYSRATDSASGS